jgi:CBS domain-containing protein
MRRDVVTASPETTLKQVARLLVEHRISGVPVCLADGRVVGVVSEADILSKEHEARTAQDAMTSPALTVSPCQDVAEAARLMTARYVNRLPVVEGPTLVGIVTRADLVRAFQRDDIAIEHEIADDVLLATLWIAPGSVQVVVEDGVVTLDGTVETHTIAEIVAAYVRRVPGVVDVVSGLEWHVEDGSLRRRTFAGRRS